MQVEIKSAHIVSGNDYDTIGIKIDGANFTTQLEARTGLDFAKRNFPGAFLTMVDLEQPFPGIQQIPNDE